MRVLSLGGLAAACVLLSACATITRGTNQDFVVQSEPSQADVKLSTGQTCVTPCTLRLKRKSNFVVTVSKPGYQTQEAPIHGVMKGGGGAALAGNAIFGGLIGAGVDASNGSLMNLKPNPLKVTLVPVGAAAPTAAEPAAAPAADPAAEPAEPAAPAPASDSGNE